MQTIAISAITIALLATMLVTASASFTPQTVDAKKSAEKCNNVKIRVNVSGVEENQTLVGVVHLDSKTVGKTVMVEQNETSATLPFNFKKLDPCPPICDMFHGFVNGTEFTGNLTSIKKPNKVSVDLS